MKKNKIKEVFRFDKSRWVIFLIVSFLFPIPLTYPSSGCQLFHQPGMLQALCSILLPTFLTIPFSIIEYGMGHIAYWYFVSTLPTSLLSSLIISFVLSYPINLLYKKIKMKKQ